VSRSFKIRKRQKPRQRGQLLDISKSLECLALVRVRTRTRQRRTSNPPRCRTAKIIGGVVELQVSMYARRSRRRLDVVGLARIPAPCKSTFILVIPRRFSGQIIRYLLFTWIVILRAPKRGRECSLLRNIPFVFMKCKTNKSCQHEESPNHHQPMSKFHRTAPFSSSQRCAHHSRFGAYASSLMSSVRSGYAPLWGGLRTRLV
jgi:hypothetical protein